MFYFSNIILLFFSNIIPFQKKGMWGAIMAATFLVAPTFIVFFNCPVISGTTYADESHCYKHNAYFYAIR